MTGIKNLQVEKKTIGNILLSSSNALSEMKTAMALFKKMILLVSLFLLVPAMVFSKEKELSNRSIKNATSYKSTLSNSGQGGQRTDGSAHNQQQILFEKGRTTYIYVDKAEEPVVYSAIGMLQQDVKEVFDADLQLTEKQGEARILISSSKELHGKWETFQIDVQGGKLFVRGSDAHGKAYGILEISRSIGVSPWEWWADVTPAKRDIGMLSDIKACIQSPSVQYRGIFLNDEDWGLNPWSSKTFEPDSKTLFPVEGHFKGAIGPKTYTKICELLLRLRANTLWPAMHEVTMPFYFVKGNREVAEKYGIYIGSSHCEPLARNSATEWDLAGKGEYNYLTNKDNLISYWSDRLKEVKNSSNIFTIGMRGKHDGAMQGVKTTEEYKSALQKVISDQTALLEKYINSDASKIPQILIPYKELLDVYNAGLKVPDYVTLMWCDDNYGYITHFPDSTEQGRSGGSGVYYHLSYWGRPHDYLWLGTTSPALLYQQMRLAYDKNSRKIWIANVGDIKPSEYQIELFLDMAWNINEVKRKGVGSHLNLWLEREFGKELGNRLLPLMLEHYRLAYIRKPEFMGNTRVEEQKPEYKIVKDLPWSEREINLRLDQYNSLSLKLENIEPLIPENREPAYFELIKYPVQATAEMNKKMLYGQLARHGKADWEQSHKAFENIVALTEHYNALQNKKWNGMMDYKPRNLSVFQKLKEEKAAESLPPDRRPLFLFNGTDHSNTNNSNISFIEGLGYQGQAVAVEKGNSLSFQMKGKIAMDSVCVELRLLPCHPINGSRLRLSISLDGCPVREIAYQTQGRSEEWKENVLRNQAIRKIAFPVEKKDLHLITLTAEDEGVVVDQIAVWPKRGDDSMPD